MEMVANAERMDREQEERARGQIGEALVCPLSHVAEIVKLMTDAR
jgi:hypothetical protein